MIKVIKKIKIQRIKKIYGKIVKKKSIRNRGDK